MRAETRPALRATVATLTLANGSSAAVSRSIGRIVPEASTTTSSERPSMLGVVGSYVTPWLYRACIRVGGRPAGCRTTRMRVPKNDRPLLCQ